MIRTDIQGDIAYIALARAASRNALGMEDWAELQSAVQTLGATSVRAIVVESAVEGAFCAGSDIQAMAPMTRQPELVEQFRLQMRAGIDALANVAIPTIANIQGDCFGAGVALALACDMRVAGDKARFGITPARLGITYPVEDIARLVKLIGPGQASRLLLTAATISATEAARIGLVELCGDADDAGRLASAIAHNAPHSVMTLKRLIRAVATHEELEYDGLFDQFFGGQDFAEGLTAFREKRRPVFADQPG